MGEREACPSASHVLLPSASSEHMRKAKPFDSRTGELSPWEDEMMQEDRKTYVMTFKFDVETFGPEPTREQVATALQDILDQAPEALDNATW